MKPYYDEAGITIYHGDCEEVLSDRWDIDLIVTSPPYNLGWASEASRPATVRMGHKGSKWTGAALADGYADHGDAMKPADYEEWQTWCLALMWSVLSDSGAIFYNHKPRATAGTLWTPLTLIPDGVPLRQIITWARAGGINFGATHYCPTYEWILVLARPEWRLKSKGASGVGDLWRIPQEPSEHPAPFPLGLPARIIETTGPSSVCDPFMGSGTTLRAAKDAGVPAIGIEKSERYCEIAAKRLAQEVLAL